MSPEDTLKLRRAEAMVFLHDGADIHIKWSGVDIIAKITHLPTGTFIEPNVQDVGQRQDLFVELVEKVQGRQ